jgi:hypothetical protein
VDGPAAALANPEVVQASDGGIGGATVLGGLASLGALLTVGARFKDRAWERIRRQ